MKKVIVYIAVSVDGFIADRDGGVAWLSGDGSDEGNMGSYPEFIKGIDTVLLGYKTYEQIVTELSPVVWPYDGMQSYVLTHRDIANTENITFTGEDLGELVNMLRSTEGEGDIWVCGGASIINRLMGLGLIDVYYLTVIPTILGEGTRLFENRKEPLKLRLIKSESYNGMTDLVYK